LLSISKKELSNFHHYLWLALIQLSHLTHVVFSLARIAIQLLVLLAESLVPLRQALPLLVTAATLDRNQAVSLARELILRDSHVFVQLILLPLHDFLDCQSHLLH
jgi:hypothetical protein